MSEPELLVTVEPPQFPLRLASASFLSTLAEVEATVKAHKITDAESAQVAASLQVRLTEAGKQLDDARKALKAPILEIGRKIDDAAKAPLARIEEAKGILKAQLSAFDAEQRRIAAEAERARQAELARLEAIARKEREEAAARQAEVERQAKEAAAKLAVNVVDIDDDDTPPVSPVKTATEKAIEAVKFAPAPVVARPSGISYKTYLVFEVEDVNKLPDVFVNKTPKLAAIRSTFCTGWSEGSPLPELAGVKFEVKRDAVSTGKAGF